MFTGIIQAQCEVKDIIRKPGLLSFPILLPEDINMTVKQGASIAIDGVCLTVSKIENNRVWFDVMKETLDKTTLGSIDVGVSVNIERSAKMGDEIGGHIVSGHVEGVVEIVAVKESENNKVMTFKVSRDWMKYIVHKGFIALDGASLTVVDPDKEKGTFDIWFIPETLAKTTFGWKKVGNRVNVEIGNQTKLIVETVERIMKSQ